MTESGSDRLAGAEVGFHGSVLLPERLGQTDGRWGAGTWYAYPIAPIMMRDKVLLYQHNLAPETFTTSKATLAWNLAFGYMLSYDLGPTNFGGGVGDPWLQVVSDFQRYVLSRYAGDRLLAYMQLPDGGTQSAFTHALVVTNPSASTPYSFAAHVLAPQGTLVALDDNSLVAGVFTSYNGVALSSGDHYLIEEHEPSAVIVRQPLGASTRLTDGRAPGWNASDPIIAVAMSQAGAVLASAPATTTASGVSFVYQSDIAGVRVAYYRLTRAYRSFLPIAR
jgi:hypothetical protein